MDESYIFKNYPLETDSFEYDRNDVKYGGADDKVNTKEIPHGGFPPIIICNKDDDKEESISDDEKDIRGFVPMNSNVVSIQNILEKRRKINPFIPK